MSSWSSDAAVHAERLRTLTVGRTVGVALLVALLATVGRGLVEPAGWPLLLSVAVAHLVVQLAILLGRLRRARTLRVAGEVALVADLAGLGVVLVVTGGAVSPLAPLLLTEAVAITLLFGRWAGLRASLLASLTIVWMQLAVPPSVQLAIDAVDRADPALATALAPGNRTVLLLAALWMTTLVTGWLSNVTARDLRRRTEDLAMLREVTPDLDPRQGPERVAQALAEVAVARLGHPAAAVWLPDTDRLVLGAYHGIRQHPSIEPLDPGLALDDELVARTVGADGVQPVRREDARPPALAALFGRRAPLALVPLRIEDRTVGLLAVEVAVRLGRRPRVRVREVRLLRMLAEQAALLFDNARLQAELTNLAVTDALTGLPNHRFLQQRIGEELDRVARQAEQGEDRALSFALLDLDHFKTVNDTYGHQTGDRVLVAVATAAARTLRGSDVVCRYGGEEFGIVLVDTDAFSARLACERVRRAIGALRMTALDGRRLGHVTASIGIATVVATAEQPTDLVADADAALYVAKAAGRDRVAHHEDAVSQPQDR
jgi:diguanylate cyclase (GGDEF)-like protein